jgi:flagellar hook protein FlgE
MGLRALNSAISGLQSHSAWLDVIGNNISNVNTLAYKTARAQFADQLSETLYAGAGPALTSNQGGQNPLQVGLGTRVASIQNLFHQGPTLVTGRATDISLQGDGFLAVKQGNLTYLTRAGNLSFDGQGNLVDQNGALVQGWNAVPEYTRMTINPPPRLSSRGTWILPSRPMSSIFSRRRVRPCPWRCPWPSWRGPSTPPE